MCMIDKNEKCSLKDRMEVAQISDDTPPSFAKECICLCSTKSRKSNIITQMKNNN